MDSQPVQDIEAALREMESLAKGGGNNGGGAAPKAKKSAKPRRKAKATAADAGPSKPFNPLTWLIKTLVTLVVVVALPFFLLVRVSLYLNVDQQMNVWLAVAAGVGAATLALLLYSALLRRKFMGTFGVTGRMSKMLLALVIVYSGYSLIYLSGTNVKSEEVKSTYLSLHPALRISRGAHRGPPSERFWIQPIERECFRAGRCE